MVSLTDYELKIEQHKDLLCEAEKERLIRQISGGQERSVNLPGMSSSLSKVFYAKNRSPALMSFKNADTGACK